MSLKKGLQISADFFECTYSLDDPKELRKTLSLLLKENGVHVLKTSSHIFSNNGATILFLLSESHFAVHTWPEKGLINIDIFLCNYTDDNRPKVKKTYKALKNLFVPKNVNIKRVQRFT